MPTTAEKPQTGFKLTQLEPSDEFQFQTEIRMTNWWQQFEDQEGRQPDLNAPHYDYRGAWLSGDGPTPTENEAVDLWPSVAAETGRLLKNPNSLPTAHLAMTKQEVLQREIDEFIDRNDPEARQPALMTRPQLLENLTENLLLRMDAAQEPLSAEDEATATINQTIQTADDTRQKVKGSRFFGTDDRPAATIGERDDLPPSTFVRLLTPVLRGVSSTTPDFVKQAYNQSLTGLAQQMVTGEQAFDLSGYNPTVVEDIAATVLSFVMPLDAITLGITGGAGGLIVNQGSKVVIKMLVKAGVKKELAEQAAQRAVTQVFAKGIESGVRLGGYTGAHEATRQLAIDGELDFDGIGDATFNGGALGFILGVAGKAVAPISKRLAAKGVFGQVQGTGLAIGTEIGAFGTGGAALEGRMPTIDDYIHATGIVLGLKLQGAATRKMRNAIGISVVPSLHLRTPAH